jgi:hypothetical protein
VKKLNPKLIQLIVLSIVLSVAAVCQAEPIQMAFCHDIFKPVQRPKPLSTAEIFLKAKMNLSVDQAPTDELDQARISQLQKIALLPDPEFREMITPSTYESSSRVEDLVKRGSTVEQALHELEIDNRQAQTVTYYDSLGRINLEALPKFNLSLENGRQKLDFARLQFSKQDGEISRKVLIDYLSFAERNRDLHLLILTDRPRSEVDSLLEKFSADVRKRVQVVETKLNITLWAQDSSKPIDLPAHALGFSIERYATENQALAESGKISFEAPLPFSLQGGDIIIGDHNVFVGGTTVMAVRTAFRVTEVDALKILSHTFQKPVLPAYIKNSQYGGGPWSFHIDLDMVLGVNRVTNREVVLVHSPEFLLSTLSGLYISAAPSEEEVRIVQRKIIKRYEAGDFGAKLSAGSRDFILLLSNATALELQMQLVQGRIFKRTLQMYGYDVRELPGFGVATVGARTYFMGTNAVLTDRYAIIPNNQMPEIDQAIVKTYQNLGYETVSMESSSASICRQGAIRCVTGTHRKPYLSRYPELPKR